MKEIAYEETGTLTVCPCCGGPVSSVDPSRYWCCGSCWDAHEVLNSEEVKTTNDHVNRQWFYDLGVRLRADGKLPALRTFRSPSDAAPPSQDGRTLKGCITAPSDEPKKAEPEEWGYWKKDEGEAPTWCGRGSRADAVDALATALCQISVPGRKRGPVQRNSDPNPFAKQCYACHAALGEHPLTDDAGRVYCDRVACWPEDAILANGAGKRVLKPLGHKTCQCDGGYACPEHPGPAKPRPEASVVSYETLAFALFAIEHRPKAALRAEAALTDQPRVDEVLARMWERKEFAEKRAECVRRAEEIVAEMGRAAARKP